VARGQEFTDVALEKLARLRKFHALPELVEVLVPLEPAQS
jgi:hypothetical protein